jgi:hypothetical protein
MCYNNADQNEYLCSETVLLTSLQYQLNLTGYYWQLFLFS